jgi:hypothetical protein
LNSSRRNPATSFRPADLRQYRSRGAQRPRTEKRIIMTGAEHYTAAEALLDEAANNPEDAGQRAALAQVHATLALAAATAMASRLVETEEGDEIAAMDPTDQEHWDNAAG